MASSETLTEPLTLAQFEQMQDPSEYRLELVGGMLVREPAPGALHGAVQMNVVRVLDAHCRAHRSGMVFVEVGYALDVRGLVRRPDVSFLLAAHVPEGEFPTGVWRRPPDLAVEVVSSSNTAVEIEQKVSEYLAAGTAEVWVVYPSAQTVIVHRADGTGHRLGKEDELEGRDLLPGFLAPVRRLFARE
jgi:Uma2 family endonuclease